jgi:hypothetical protein
MNEPLVLRQGRFSGADPTRDLTIARGRVASAGVAGALEVELEGRTVLPGLVNALDVLDLSVFPPLGEPPFASLYDWTSLAADHPALRAALAVPLVDRLFLGGLRNLLSGATAVVHHHPWHRSLARDDFPVRVLARYQFAHSPGRNPKLRQTYRSTDRRIPWLVRVAEGTDDRARGELEALQEANILRQNTVILHGTGLRSEDGPRIAEARAAVVWCPEADRRLYGATAPVRALRAAGVRIGLGSDSPATGSRDALSNLAAARREGVLDDTALVHLATLESAEVARLPAGGIEEGSPADFVITGALDALLDGDRRALALVVVNGRPLYGEPPLLAAAGAAVREIRVDGAVRGLAEPFALRLRAIRKAHPAVSAVQWLSGISL